MEIFDVKKWAASKWFIVDRNTGKPLRDKQTNEILYFFSGMLALEHYNYWERNTEQDTVEVWIEKFSALTKELKSEFIQQIRCELIALKVGFKVV